MILILFKHSNKNKLYLLKATSMKNLVIKRTIMSCLYGLGHQGTKTVGNYAKLNRIPKIRKDIHYHVDDATAMSSSHELAKKNPILKKAWKKGTKDNSFQHPVIGRDKCEKPGCETKPCSPNKTDCGVVTKVEAIGHGTHADSTKVPNVEHLSNTDFNGQPRPQYGSFYSANKRVPVPINEQTYNENTTKEVNNNEEMMNNINMHKHLND